jgi:hypothetical protein
MKGQYVNHLDSLEIERTKALKNKLDTHHQVKQDFVKFISSHSLSSRLECSTVIYLRPVASSIQYSFWAFF